MQATERAKYRRRLSTLLRRITGAPGDRWECAEAEGDDASDRARLADDRQVEHTLDANEDQLVAEVRAALERLHDGTFGQCAECGHAISAARLDALPCVRLCLQCACGAEVAHA